jgi:hypothetical protein
MEMDPGPFISEVYVELLNHFTRFEQTSKDSCVLFSLDNHIFHCGLYTATFCKKMNHNRADEFTHMRAIRCNYTEGSCRTWKMDGKTDHVIT